MKPVYWLASYPKSGNTWLRMLVNALALRPQDALDINALREQPGIASAREPLDRLTFLDSQLLTHDEIDRLRPRVYEEIARGAGDDDEDAACALPARFVKTHDAYAETAAGEPLMAGARGANGAIVIVRDPRAVAPSLANHLGAPIDKAVALMSDDAFCLCGEDDRRHRQMRQRLLGWSAHVASWLDQRDIPVHLLRYEELCADTHAALERMLGFAGASIPDAAIDRAVHLARFSELQRQESERGFDEAPRRRVGRFFRRGEAQAWRDELTEAQIARIEQDHAAMMARLGYETIGARGDHPAPNTRSINQ
jgi:hypothetical protein